MNVSKQTMEDMVKLYTAYKLSRYYHPSTDLGSFILFIQESLVTGKEVES